MTFSMNERYVEGFLLKEIEGMNIIRETRRHLRYFRIVFSTGKLNIKTCVDAKQMRSFELKDMLDVKITTTALQS